MTGYQTAQTIEDVINQYSPIGGVAYGLLRPLLDELLKKNLGIRLPANMPAPGSTGFHQIQGLFNESDSERVRELTDAMRWQTGFKPGNSIMQSMSRFMAMKLDERDKVVPAMSQLLLDVGVRNSFTSPGGNKTYLDLLNDNKLKMGTSAITNEEDITNAFSDAMIRGNTFGMTRGERAELAANFIRSNTAAIAGYRHEKTDDIFMQSDYNDTRVTDEYKDKFVNSINTLNTLLQSSSAKDMKLKRDASGNYSLEGANDTEESKNIQKLVTEVNTATKRAHGAFSTELTKDGEIKVTELDGVIKDFNKLQENIRKYSQGIKAWSDTLGLKVEQAAGQLNAIAGYDIAATFNNNYDTLRDTAMKSRHINALAGKGNAYAQTSIQAASSMLRQLGGEGSAAFKVGIQAAMIQNSASKYRLNESQQDAYNVSMVSGMNESQTSKLLSAAFALGGYDSTEEGRRKFWDDLNKAGIDGSNVDSKKLQEFLQSKGKQVSAYELHTASSLDAALDFRDHDNSMLEVSMQAAEKDVLKTVSEIPLQGAGKQKLQELLSTDGGKQVFFEAMSADVQTRRKMLQSHGLSVDDITSIERGLHEQVNRGSLRHFQNSRNLMQFMAGNSTRRARQEEVRKRAEIETLLNESEGDSMKTRVFNLLSGGANEDTIRLVAETAMKDFGLDIKQMAGALEGSPEEVKTRLKQFVQATGKVDKAIENTENVTSDGDTLRKDTLKKYNEMRQRGVLTPEQQREWQENMRHLYGGTIDFDKKGNVIVNNKVDPKTSGNVKAQQKAARWAQDVSESGSILTEEARQMFIDDNKNYFKDGDYTQRDLVLTRAVAVDEIKTNEAALNRAKTERDALRKKYTTDNKFDESKMTEEDKEAMSNLNKRIADHESRVSKAKSAFKKVGGKIDENGKITTEDVDDFLDNPDKADRALKGAQKDLGQAWTRASQQMGHQPKTNVADILNSILQFLKQNVTKRPAVNFSIG